jgi:uncharacterized protein YggE
MAEGKRRGRAGSLVPAPLSKARLREEMQMTPARAGQAQTHAMEGVAVMGEAVRRVTPESTEFLIEIAATGQTAAQALQNHQAKTTQNSQTVAPLGVQRTDFQTVSMNVVNSYGTLTQTLPPYGAPPQLAPAGFSVFGSAVTGLQPELQFGSYQARSLLRVNVREAARAGEIVDALTKAGGALVGGFSFHAADESAARKAALEAAGRDARAKAEALATAAGKEIGDPLAVCEDVVASNGVYSALRAQAPLAFGAGAPAMAGELEYYARVTASYRFH